MEAAEKSTGILKFIKERLCEMIYKLQEVDETDVELVDKQKVIKVAELPDFLVNKAQDLDLIKVWQETRVKYEFLNFIEEITSSTRVHGLIIFFSFLLSFLL